MSTTTSPSTRTTIPYFHPVSHNPKRKATPHYNIFKSTMSTPQPPLTPFQFGPSALLLPSRTPSSSSYDSPQPLRRYESSHRDRTNPSAPVGLFDNLVPRARTASSDSGSVALSEFTAWSEPYNGALNDQLDADEAALDAAEAAHSEHVLQHNRFQHPGRPYTGHVLGLSTEQLQQHPYVKQLIQNTWMTNTNIQSLTQEQLRQHPYVQGLLQLVADLSLSLQLNATSPIQTSNLSTSEHRSNPHPLSITYPRSSNTVNLDSTSTDNSDNRDKEPGRDSIDPSMYPTLFWFRSHATEKLNNNTFNLPLRRVILRSDGAPMDKHRFNAMRDDARDMCIDKFRAVPDLPSQYKFKTFEYFSVRYPDVWNQLRNEYAAKWVELTYCHAHWKAVAMLGQALRNLKWPNSLYEGSDGQGASNSSGTSYRTAATSNGTRPEPVARQSRPGATSTHTIIASSGTTATPGGTEPTTAPPAETGATPSTGSTPSRHGEDWPSNSLQILLGRTRPSNQANTTLSNANANDGPPRRRNEETTASAASETPQEDQQTHSTAAVTSTGTTGSSAPTESNSTNDTGSEDVTNLRDVSDAARGIDSARQSTSDLSTAESSTSVSISDNTPSNARGRAAPLSSELGSVPKLRATQIVTEPEIRVRKTSRQNLNRETSAF
ncbi:hypothetical protein CF319_g4213 [Tilletia indica]|nr:hypothetical protein CF319_g4213 [Tilletia indica]